MAWCGKNGLILAIRNEYFYLKLVKNDKVSCNQLYYLEEAKESDTKLS